MRFIKLTGAGDDADQHAIYIAVEHILSIIPYAYGSTVYLNTGFWRCVNEDAETILKLINPDLLAM